MSIETERKKAESDFETARHGCSKRSLQLPTAVDVGRKRRFRVNGLAETCMMEQVCLTVGESDKNRGEGAEDFG